MEPQAAHRATAIVFVGAALLVALSILTRAVNHDEGQYVAAIAMMRGGWPYLDFPYLQTPLQPLLLSTLSMLPAGWLLVAARCANGLFALATLATLFGALRDRVQPRSALIAIAALACTEPFLLASSLARNDALPMVLIAGGIAAMVGAIGAQRSGRALALAGLLLGLATSAKISAAAPAAAAGLFVLLRARRFGLLGLGAFALGALAGLAPIAIAAIATLQHFWFGAFAYSLEAPQQWWTIVGRAADLEPLHRIGRLIELALLGPMPFALVAAALDRRRSEERLLLDLMIVCGLVGAYLPEPPFTQYLVPLLPPLFARFGLAVDGGREHWRRPLLLLSVVAGLVYTGVYTVAGLPKGGIDLVQAVRQGRAVARLAAGGTIVTLSPEAFVGADTHLDRGFVTGPFLFRTYGDLSATALRLGFAPNWQRLDTALAARPPAVIVTGRETKRWPPLFPNGLDAPLADWAVAHGYTPVRLAGGSTAFVRRSAAR
ncbi:MAG: glycosyltransferase 87 family protein [Pseudomonadota bacterium]